LPFDKMLPADRYLMPPIFHRGKKIISHAYQDLSKKILLRPVEIKEVQSFLEND